MPALRRPLPGLHHSERHVAIDHSPADVWEVLVAPQLDGEPRWYADALPLVVRGRLDRVAEVVLGPTDRHPLARPVSRGPLLAEGDPAGFWTVTGVDHGMHRLRLQARVHAPGDVRLTSWLTPRTGGCHVYLRITFAPRGLLGAAYLAADLPARELVTELTTRRLVTDIGAALD